MLRSRILYGAALLGAVLFHIFNTSYIAYFVWLLALATPFAALAVSLPAILGCRVEVRAAAHSVPRGEKAHWEICLKNRFSLPVSHVTCIAESRNCMTGKRSAQRIRLDDGQARVFPADTAHCGRLEYRTMRVRVCDCLGLFAIRRRAALSSLAVLPVACQPSDWNNLENGNDEGGLLRPRPGGGPGEDYDLRPYRPGDPIRSIHWKLSSKRGALIVKEILESHQSTVLLTFEHFGSAADMDSILDQADGLCRALIEKQRPCYVQWLHPSTGELRSCRVCSDRERESFLAAALSDPAPKYGHSILGTALGIPGVAGPIRHMHIAAEKEDDG